MIGDNFKIMVNFKFENELKILKINLTNFFMKQYWTFLKSIAKFDNWMCVNKAF